MMEQFQGIWPFAIPCMTTATKMETEQQLTSKQYFFLRTWYDPNSRRGCDLYMIIIDTDIEHSVHEQSVWDKKYLELAL